MGILAWVVLGLIAGALAKLVYPGHQGGWHFGDNRLGYSRSFSWRVCWASLAGGRDDRI